MQSQMPDDRNEQVKFDNKAARFYDVEKQIHSSETANQAEMRMPIRKMVKMREIEVPEEPESWRT